MTSLLRTVRAARWAVPLFPILLAMGCAPAGPGPETMEADEPEVATKPERARPYVPTPVRPTRGDREVDTSEPREPELVIEFTQEEMRAIREREERERLAREESEREQYGKVLTEEEREEIRMYGRLLTEEERQQMATERAQAEAAAEAEAEAARQAELEALEEERLLRREELLAKQRQLEEEREQDEQNPTTRLEYLKAAGLYPTTEYELTEEEQEELEQIEAENLQENMEVELESGAVE